VRFFSTRAGVSGLFLLVCCLVLVPLSPASSAAAPMGSSSGWNPSWTASRQATLTGQHSWSDTWQSSWTWQHSWTGTWQSSWTATWSHTSHTRSHQTWTQYSTWTQYYPGCYPNYQYCNGYYPPYPNYPSYPYSSPGYALIGLRPLFTATGSQESATGYGFLPTDTVCIISSPNTPDVILTGTAACTIQAGTGMAVGGFTIGNVPPGYYVVQLTGNEGDSAQAIVVVQ